ncbi:MAG: polyprenyl synthetase family protein [Pseudomonadota bacterium]
MLSEALAGNAASIQRFLNEKVSGDTALQQAMRHALSGGKRLRAFLVMEAARIHGVSEERAMYPAAAIEAMHAYSLVHDDLPCMDDDEMRRGEPTVHVKWDEAMAVLVGDALQALAFEFALHPDGAEDAYARAELGRTLAQCAGMQGMVLGQTLDIAAETAEAPLSLEDIIDLQAGKTGALFTWAATAGAVMAGASVQPLCNYARNIGLAFQIQDDVIDVTGKATEVGKAVGKDSAAGKATFVSLLGLDEARKRAAALADNACESIDVYGAKADALKQLAQFIVTREL